MSQNSSSQRDGLTGIHNYVHELYMCCTCAVHVLYDYVRCKLSTQGNDIMYIHTYSTPVFYVTHMQCLGVNIMDLCTEKGHQEKQIKRETDNYIYKCSSIYI